MDPSGSFVGTDETPTNAGEAEQRSSASTWEDQALSNRKSPEAESRAVAEALDAELEALEEVFEREIEAFDEELEGRMEAFSSQFEEQFEALRRVANLRRFEPQHEREFYEIARNLGSLAEGVWGEDLQRRVDQAMGAQQRAIGMRMEAAARRMARDAVRLESARSAADRVRLHEEMAREMRLMLPTAEELEEIRASVDRIRTELGPRMREFDRIRTDVHRALREWRMSHAAELETLLNQAREMIGDLE